MSCVVLPGHNNDDHCYLRYHCAIGDDDSVVLTGGRDAWSLVTRYNVYGEATSLPSLNTGRYVHACGTFTTADQETVRLGDHEPVALYYNKHCEPVLVCCGYFLIHTSS